MKEWCPPSRRMQRAVANDADNCALRLRLIRPGHLLPLEHFPPPSASRSSCLLARSIDRPLLPWIIVGCICFPVSSIWRLLGRIAIPPRPGPSSASPWFRDFVWCILDVERGWLRRRPNENALRICSFRVCAECRECGGHVVRLRSVHFEGWSRPETVESYRLNFVNGFADSGLALAEFPELRQLLVGVPSRIRFFFRPCRSRSHNVGRQSHRRRDWHASQDAGSCHALCFRGSGLVRRHRLQGHSVLHQEGTHSCFTSFLRSFMSMLQCPLFCICIKLAKVVAIDHIRGLDWIGMEWTSRSLT